jgi:hypothetical protein
MLIIRTIGLGTLAGCAIAGLAFGNWIPLAVLLLVLIAFVTVFHKTTHPQRTAHRDARGWGQVD